MRVPEGRPETSGEVGEKEGTGRDCSSVGSEKGRGMNPDCSETVTRERESGRVGEIVGKAGFVDREGCGMGNVVS